MLPVPPSEASGCGVFSPFECWLWCIIFASASRGFAGILQQLVDMERIFLIGFMCSGKTTLGRLLAGRTGYGFIDLDEYIVEQQGKSVNDIFAEGGEEEFRKIEREALHRVAEGAGNAVIAAGGGTPCFFDNMEYINASGKSVYLYSSQEELLRRVERYSASRPLLRGKSREELRKYISEALSKRERFYNMATLRFDVGALMNAADVEDAVNRLCRLLCI